MVQDVVDTYRAFDIPLETVWTDIVSLPRGEHVRYEGSGTRVAPLRLPAVFTSTSLFMLRGVSLSICALDLLTLLSFTALIGRHANTTS